MQTKSSAATTAVPPTPTAALLPAAPPATTLKETLVASLLRTPTSASQQRFEALWAERIAAVLDALAPTEKAPRTPDVPAPAAATPLEALAARLPMTKTGYKRVAIKSTTLYDGSVLEHAPVSTLVRNDQGSVISRHPELTPWTDYKPQSRVYNLDWYIDGPGLAALSRKMGATVVFANTALTTLSALSKEDREARRKARKEEAKLLDAERAARAATYARTEAERLERLEAQRADARAERAKANARARAARKAERLEAQRLKEAAKAQRRADARAERAAVKAERKEAQPLSAAARRLLSTLRALGGRMVPYAQRALARAQGTVGMAATVKALAHVAKTWGRYTTFDEDDLEVLNEDFQNAYTLILPACERAAVRAARPLNKDKGVPKALTLALTLALKVRG